MIVYTFSMDKKAETLKAYNQGAKEFAHKFDQMGTLAQDVDKAFSYFHKKNAKVLEIGCGNGRDAKEILKHTSNYLGIDIAEELIKIAKINLPAAHFEAQDFETYEFPPNLDIIFAFASLLHINKENLKSVLDKAWNRLNDKGIFFISLQYDSYQEKIKADEHGERTFYFYTPKLIEELAASRYKKVYEELRNFKGQEWFIIILQK